MGQTAAMKALGASCRARGCITTPEVAHASPFVAGASEAPQKAPPEKRTRALYRSPILQDGRLRPRSITRSSRKARFRLHNVLGSVGQSLAAANPTRIPGLRCARSATNRRFAPRIAGQVIFVAEPSTAARGSESLRRRSQICEGSNSSDWRDKALQLQGPLVASFRQ